MDEMWKKTREKLLRTNRDTAMIAAHRGKFGSSVIENTSLAFKLAIAEGADMVEMDIISTYDGELIGFHDDEINRITGHEGRVDEITFDKIRNLELLTYLRKENNIFVETFDEIARALKNKTILVIDRGWNFWQEIYDTLVKYDMVEQAVFKFNMVDQYLFNEMKKYKDIMYIPMSDSVEDLKDILELKNINNIVGVEILPDRVDCEMFSKDYIDELHNNGLLVWCNSLSDSKTLIYGAGYNDNLSLTKGGDAGWGMLIKLGVDIIQTDWIYELKSYIEGKNNFVD